MSSPRVSSEDAIHVYALTIAYLRDEKLDTSAVTDTMYVKEMLTGVFYFWRRDRSKRQKDRTSPHVVCTYDEKARTWKVDLGENETFTLVDKGSVWEPLDEERYLPTLNAVYEKELWRKRKRR